MLRVVEQPFLVDVAVVFVVEALFDGSIRPPTIC
jgi:hypothetical protein